MSIDKTVKHIKGKLNAKAAGTHATSEFAHESSNNTYSHSHNKLVPQSNNQNTNLSSTNNHAWIRDET